jgi:hypothetical protein
VKCHCDVCPECYQGIYEQGFNAGIRQHADHSYGDKIIAIAMCVAGILCGYMLRGLK